MTPAMWAILLRPIFNVLFFFLVVAPIAWLIYRVFPAGRLKVFLFRVRTGPHATRRDKAIMALAAVLGYALLGVLVVTLSAGIG
jgi:hypothetical protein